MHSLSSLPSAIRSTSPATLLRPLSTVDQSAHLSNGVLRGFHSISVLRECVRLRVSGLWPIAMLPRCAAFESVGLHHPWHGLHSDRGNMQRLCARQLLNWRKHRKMAFQLLSVSCSSSAAVLVRIHGVGISVHLFELSVEAESFPCCKEVSPHHKNFV